jgi:serine/threonine-protein kinase
LIGTQFGNYRIEEKLGEGGMGVVYKATDLSLDRVVAIKVLGADFSRDPALMERFRAEAKAQAQMNHTNVAALYTLVNAEGNTGIVMEYLEGETFDHTLRRRGLIPWEEAIPLFRQALLGVGFAHRMGIIHRDLKPSNIMVNRYGVVKVMDFGIAKVLGGQRLTRTGMQVGTVAYMSPEQIRNRPLDIRSDIYSLGVTLYELLTAHLPFENESDFQVMSDHVNTPPPPPTRYYPYIPRGIEQCVLKALEKDPDARFQTVEEFGAALEHPNGIEEWLAQRPPVGFRTPATGVPVASPPPAGGYPGAGSFATPPSSFTPVPGATNVQHTPPPGYQTPPPGFHTPPPGFQTPSPASQPAAPIRAAKPPLWQNKPVVFGGAAVLVLALATGGYALFRPKPVLVHSGGGGGGGGSTLIAGATSHDAPPKKNETLKNPNPSDTAGTADLNQALKTATTSLDTSTNQNAGVKTTPGNEDASSQLLDNANRALSSGRLFRPRTSSAFYLAKQAEQNGSKDAAALEQTILHTAVAQVERLRDAKNYVAASALMRDAMTAYPNRPDLVQLNASIQSDQQQYARQQAQLQAEQQAQLQQQQHEQQLRQQEQEQERLRQQLAAQQAETERQRQLQAQQQQSQPQNPLGRQQAQGQAVQFMVQHRHVMFGEDLNRAYCTGILSIASNGTVRYDCMQSMDRRCDHVTFNVADVKQVKMTWQHALHIATKTMGNWDFFGGQSQQAMQALSQAVSASH